MTDVFIRRLPPRFQFGVGTSSLHDGRTLVSPTEGPALRRTRCRGVDLAASRALCGAEWAPEIAGNSDSRHRAKSGRRCFGVNCNRYEGDVEIGDGGSSWPLHQARQSGRGSEGEGYMDVEQWC